MRQGDKIREHLRSGQFASVANAMDLQVNQAHPLSSIPSLSSLYLLSFTLIRIEDLGLMQSNGCSAGLGLTGQGSQLEGGSSRDTILM